MDSAGELAVFRSVEDAELHLEAIDVAHGEYTAYDVRGRRLIIGLVQRRRRGLFGRWGQGIEVATITVAEENPDGSSDLRAALEHGLARLGMDPLQLRAASLDDLVAKVGAQLGYG